MKAWLVVILMAFGTALMTVAKADLEDAKVCRWLARKLIHRAARHLPRGERARWREESIRNILDLPGRLPPLLWALDVYVRSGSWGRMRGAPSPWQALVVRIRTAWQWLRSLRQARALARSKALSKQLHPAFQARPEPARVVRSVALDAILASGTTRSTGSATLGSPSRRWAT